MADGIDLILNAAEQSQRLHDEAGREVAELASAQDATNDATAKNLEAALADMQNYQQVQAEAAETKKAAFAEMQGDIARLNEMNSMPGILDQIIGPFASLFDANWDRSKLASEIALARERVNIADAKQNLAKESLEIRQAKRATELKKHQVRQQGEAQDLANVQARINLNTGRVQELRGMKQAFVASASEDELRAAVASGFITERDMRTAQRRERAQELQLSAAEFGERARQLQGMQEEELQGLMGTSMQPMAQDEMVRRTTRDLQAQAARRQALEYEVQKASPQNLNQMLADGIISRPQLEQELNRRENKELALESARMAVEGQRMNVAEKARMQALKFMDLATLDRAAEKAIGTGTVVIDGMRYTADEVEQARATYAGVQASRIAAEVARAGAEASMENAAGRAARVNGIPDNGDEPMAIYQVLANDPNASPAVRATATEIVTLGRMLAESDVPDMAQAELMDASATALNEIIANEAEARASIMPKPQRAAYMEFVSTGQVENPGAALDSMATAVATGQNTGSDYYDAGLIAARNLAGQVRNSQPELAFDKDVTPSDLLAPIAADPNMRDEVAAAFHKQGMMKVFTEAARELGDIELMRMINNRGGALYNENNVFSPARLLEHLAQRSSQHEVQLANFMVASDTIARRVARSEFRPTGNQASVQAAMNRLVFDNRVEIDFVDYYSTKMHESMGEHRRRTQRRELEASISEQVMP